MPRKKYPGKWMLHCEQLHNLYSSINITKVVILRRLKMTWTCNSGWSKKYIQNFGGETYCRRCKDNTEMELTEVGCGDMNETEITQDHTQWYRLWYWQCWTVRLLLSELLMSRHKLHYSFCRSVFTRYIQVVNGLFLSVASTCTL